MNAELKASIKEATSQKGNIYKYLSIMLTDSLEKRVFLTQAELELLELKAKEVNPFKK